jgi:hypothetical protein
MFAVILVLPLLDVVKEKKEEKDTMRRIILFIHCTFNGVVTGDPNKDKTNLNTWPQSSSVETGSQCLLKTEDSLAKRHLFRGSTV